jgi:hypothetical protein
MAEPVFYNSPEEAVKAASASVSFDAQRNGIEFATAKEIVVSDPRSEDDARNQLDAIMKGMADEWSVVS